MHNIIQLPEEKRREALDLSMYAFQYNVKEEDIPRRLNYYSKQEIYGIFTGDELAAKLHLMTHEVILQEKRIKMGGIASVATYPEHRRTGMVDALLKNALSIMKEKGMTLSFLHPFKISFYRRYGWEIFSHLKKIELERSDLQPLPFAGGRIVRYKKDTHPLEANELYHRFALRFGGMLARSSYWWDYAVYHDCTLAIYYDMHDVPQSYILYKVSDKLIDVQELISLNYEGTRGIWNFICQHDSMVEKAKIRTSVHDPFPYYLSEPKIKTEISPYFMARIVDAQEFLRNYKFKEIKKEICIHVLDDTAPWNNERYLINNRGITLLENNSPNGGDNVSEGITVSIQALTSVLLGVQKAEVLADIGQISGNREDIANFSQAVPEIKPFFYDFF